MQNQNLTEYLAMLETVCEPFLGVGSGVFSAVSLGRMGVGIELKQSYFKQAIKNMELCKDRFTAPKQLDMFDDMEEIEEA